MTSLGSDDVIATRRPDALTTRHSSSNRSPDSRELGAELNTTSTGNVRPGTSYMLYNIVGRF
jgi:hypothetical protein